MRADTCCDGRLRATRPHNMSSGSHSVRLGRWFLALLLLSRTVASTVGCGPAAGSLGGKCQDNGCNTYCDGGLQCDNGTNTCVGPADVSSGPPSCASTDPALCPGAAGTEAWLCPGEESPAPFEFFSDCAAKRPLWGETLFCCTPHPGCTSRTGSACESPSAAFLCTGAATPAWDAGLSLCASYSLTGVFTDYCCISDGECFGAPSGVQCSGFARPYYCAGSATPAVGDSGIVCTPVDSQDGGGAGLTGYCCQR